MADNTPIDIIRSRSYDHDRISKLSSRRDDTVRQCSSSPQEKQNRTEAEELEAKYQQDVPPDGGYGWVCVACVFWMNAHTWGINSVSLLLRVAYPAEKEDHN